MKTWDQVYREQQMISPDERLAREKQERYIALSPKLTDKYRLDFSKMKLNEQYNTKEVMTSDGTTHYIYENGDTYYYDHIFGEWYEDLIP